MLIDQIATLLTQLLVHYLPFGEIGVKITCGMAITSILITSMNYIYNSLSTVVKRKFNFKYIVILTLNQLKFYLFLV